MKKGIALLLLAALVSLCGCAANEKTESSVYEGVEISADENGLTYILRSDVSEMSQGSRLEIKEKSDVSAPEDSISFQEACDLIDSCNMDMLYLPQKASDYEKLYFATVDEGGDPYYSIYNCIVVGNKKILVGTNCLVSCNGQNVYKKSWVGAFEEVTLHSSGADQTVKERYPDARITPNEALKVLAENEEGLRLEDDITQYVFEFDEKLVTAESIPCYKITPKIEYTNSVELKTAYYVSAYGTGEVFFPKSDGSGFTRIG